ncbi:MAG: MCE family protein [Spirochaetaceae bacterium]|nr:MAG: MCE family protein [Spirochaetaceae bacterium]
MVSRTSKLRVGLFVLISASVLFLFFFSIAGSEWFRHYDEYEIHYTDTSVNGLQVGGTVRYQGIDIGTVNGMFLHPEDVSTVIVEISVAEGTRIPADVQAQLVPVGITGLMQIELTGGSNEAPILRSGQQIPAGRSAFARFTQPAESIALGLQSVLGDVSELLDEANRRQFAELLANLNALVYENRESVGIILANMQVASDNLAESSLSFRSVIARIDEQTADLDLPAMIDNINRTTEHAGQTIADIDLTVMQSRRNLVSSIEVLRETMIYLNDFALQISENPGALLRTRGGSR